MTYPNLSLIGLDFGGTTGWARFVVPRACFYGSAESEILEFKYGELYGDEDKQVRELCGLARASQGLSYKVGPALIGEGFDLAPSYSNTNADTVLSPVRLAAKLGYAVFRGDADGAKLTLQPRTLGFQMFPDERVKKYGYYVPGPDHIKDAIRIALTALRRAKEKPSFRDEIWNRAA